MAAGLLEVARVACELGGEAGRGVGEITSWGAKGTSAGTSAHLCGPSERTCSWEKASETSGERNPQLRGLQQFAALSFPSY